MKRVLFSCLLGALLLGGGANEAPLLQNAARGVLTAKYSDQAAIAIRSNDEKKLKNANEQLAKVAPLLAAEKLVEAASRLDMRAHNLEDKTQKQTLQNEAAQKYRAALEIAPDFDSDDPNLLNALGYFLAERGTSTPDFQTGERLARRSLKMWDALVKEAEDSFLPGADKLLAVRRFMRANVRDSVAWALYRQGKYAEALKEQTAAVREAEVSTAQIGEKVPDELYDHLQTIRQAAGRKPKPESQPNSAPEVQPETEPEIELEPDERKVARRTELKNE